MYNKLARFPIYQQEVTVVGLPYMYNLIPKNSNEEYQNNHFGKLWNKQIEN